MFCSLKFWVQNFGFGPDLYPIVLGYSVLWWMSNIALEVFPINKQ